ncbi:arginine-glutamic acid dipeptide repeats protein-like [Bombus terrestris]|uniref:Arginine-glutamic acid dipeptide repeats protein-like n=1 Tax=Bombus terrestris TaxID=30195 RepID=A0A9C6SPC4_BOMTE|nr:arginine-glutamic acid dipeptide repeats protein-like [Bombus terrestris]
MSRKSVARRKRKVCSKQKKKTTDRRMEYAVIHECQDRSYANKEYTTTREEKMWDPKVDVEGWIFGYSLAARAVLTLKQQYEGIPNIKAIENSCSGVAEQYISDVLHESNYEPHDALRMIFMKDMPQKIIDKWKPEEMKLFTSGIMKYGKRFSIIRRKMLPHKRVEDFANFYYVWKRSSMAADWRESRMEIKAEKLKMKEEQEKRWNNERVSNLSKNELSSNLSSTRIMTRSATAAAKLALQNSEGDEDSKSSRSTSPSEKNGETSSTAESTDSSTEYVQKRENVLPETATSENSPMRNEQIAHNSMKCPRQRYKRKWSIPRKIVNFEEKFLNEIEEIKCVPAPIIPQWKRQRRSKNTLFNNTRAIYQRDLRLLM